MDNEDSDTDEYHMHRMRFPNANKLEELLKNHLSESEFNISSTDQSNTVSIQLHNAKKVVEIVSDLTRKEYSFDFDTKFETPPHIKVHTKTILEDEVETETDDSTQ